MKKVKLKVGMKLKLEEDLIFCSFFDLATDAIQGIEFDGVLCENNYEHTKKFLQYIESNNMRKLIKNYYYFTLPIGTIIKINECYLNYLNYIVNIKINEKLNIDIPFSFYIRTNQEKVADKLLNNTSNNVFVEIIE